MIKPAPHDTHHNRRRDHDHEAPDAMAAAELHSGQLASSPTVV
jgi:hypothetical protein